MSIAFVLGNGISRKGLELHDLKQHGTIYGCNALYRDYTPEVLVATDRPIAEHIEKTGYPMEHKFYTRRPNLEAGSRAVPKKYFGFSSGPIAVSLAALDKHETIYMIGFDMGPSPDNTFNNLYASTDFYKTTGSTPTYTGNWVKQIQQICSEFMDTTFVRVMGTTTVRLPELDKIKNMTHLPLSQLNDQLNKQRNF